MEIRDFFSSNRRRFIDDPLPEETDPPSEDQNDDPNAGDREPRKPVPSLGGAAIELATDDNPS